MRNILLLGLALFAFGANTRANDGFGGIGANGLEFAQNDKVAMKSEDLFISLDKIKVSYVFANNSDEDMTGEVIFPLPPIWPMEMIHTDMNLPENPDRENLVNFTVEADGKNITPKVERRAVRFSYDTETGAPVHGGDVTAQLAEAGVPLSLKPERILAALESLPPATLQKLVADNLLEIRDAPAEGWDRYFCKWAVAVRYHWTQTFPAGSEVVVRHEYENYPPGGIWYWQHPASEDYQREIGQRYCIDEATSKALARCRACYNITYILGTANTWKGPIGKFKLTIDKGAPQNILSLCAEGVEKTGPTTFVIEKTDYSPPEELHILIAKPSFE